MIATMAMRARHSADTGAFNVSPNSPRFTRQSTRPERVSAIVSSRCVSLDWATYATRWEFVTFPVRVFTLRSSEPIRRGTGPTDGDDHMIPAHMIRAATIVAIGIGATAIAADAAPVAAAEPCEIVDADVESGTAMFTVGPAGCSGEVGPISFSVYSLPSGEIEPYADQVLIAHADANGRSYGAGTYTLTASVGDALNWQA